MIDFNATLDTKEFDRVFEKYLEVKTPKVIEDVINRTVYFVARTAVNTTPAATEEEIRKELLAPSAVAPGAPLAAILVQKGRANKGKTKRGRMGLAGERMAIAIEKLIRSRLKTRNFLRAGWIAAIKAVEPFIKKKGGAPKYDRKVKIKGSPKGGGKVAKLNSFWKGTAEIFNSVQGGKTPSPRVNALLIEGLQKAIDSEAKDKLEYVAKKELERNINDFNRS
jgi:hypothetical protein